MSKIRLILITMTMISILVVIMATAIIGSANASSVDQTKSDLKMITKFVPGYGNVTAREDMFVGEGDNISIVINSDYKEKGVITPMIEYLPNVTYVEVDTPCGKVNVSQSTYDILGKDKIAADFMQLIAQRNELIDSGKIKPLNVTKKTDTLISKSASNSPQRLITKTLIPETWVREDLGFARISGFYPKFIWGEIISQASSPVPPSDYVSYQELEVHLDNTGDVIEFISHHRNDQRTVWVSLFDRGNWLKYVPTPNFENVNGPIEYYFNYNPVLGYIMYLYNPATSEAHQEVFLDNTTSTYITLLDASAEFRYNTQPLITCHDETVIHQYIAMAGSTYYLPADLFSMGTVGSRSQYVDISGTQEYGQYTTTHKDGSDIS